LRLQPRKKVLMLAYHYPPVIASGCARIKRFTDNLPSFGYEPLVVTVKGKGSSLPDREGNVYRSREIRYDGVAKLDMLVRKFCQKCGVAYNFRLFDRLLMFPDFAVGFVPYAVSRGLEVHREHGCRLIYVTCKPFSTALAAVYLKKKLNLPLVVDFRDPYAYDYHEDSPPYHAFMKRMAERLVLKHADCLVINTKGGEELYRSFYGDLNITTINNGFDYRSTPRNTKNDRMVISHVGHLYGLQRDPERLFAAIARLGKSRILFRSIGDTYRGIMEKARQYGIGDKIEVTGNLPHEQALAAIHESDVLFLSQLAYINRYYSISIANKSFEYLETGKPVIADVPEGDNADLFRRYSSNSYVITDRDPEKIYNAVKDAYGKWESGELGPQVNEEFIARFNGKYLTGQLSRVFDTVLGGGVE
jgi:glycosyltransferase involved in cell wall biosynthesis